MAGSASMQNTETLRRLHNIFFFFLFPFSFFLFFFFPPANWRRNSRKLTAPLHATVKLRLRRASSAARIDLAERLFVGFGFSNLLSEKLEPSQAPLPFQSPTATSNPNKMAACSAAKRPRPTALEATVTTVTIPGLGEPDGMFVLGDGTRLFSSSSHTILQLTPSGRLSTIAGNPEDEDGEVVCKDGQGIFARFNGPEGLTVDRAGNVVVADYGNHAIRSVSKEGAVVSTLAGGRQEDDDENDDENDVEVFADGQGQNARVKFPTSVVVAANGDIFVSDFYNSAIGAAL
jgi:sugar lactone lactonase YvrE